MRYTFFFLFLCVCFLASCKFNPNLQGTGVDFLQGEWQEDSVLYQDKLLEFTKHRFTFTCDSFYAYLETHAKVNRYPESCFNNGLIKEYAKGQYVMNKDTLYLIGTFTKSDFKQKISGCYRIGRYIPRFIVTKEDNKLIQLVNLQNNFPITLKLKQRISCNPKPL
jgi:hypothetical protein